MAGRGAGARSGARLGKMCLAHLKRSLGARKGSSRGPEGVFVSSRTEERKSWSLSGPRRGPSTGLSGLDEGSFFINSKQSSALFGLLASGSTSYYFFNLYAVHCFEGSPRSREIRRFRFRK